MIMQMCACVCACGGVYDLTTGLMLLSLVIRVLYVCSEITSIMVRCVVVCNSFIFRTANTCVCASTYWRICVFTVLIIY